MFKFLKRNNITLEWEEKSVATTQEELTSLRHYDSGDIQIGISIDQEWFRDFGEFVVLDDKGICAVLYLPDVFGTDEDNLCQWTPDDPQQMDYHHTVKHSNKKGSAGYVSKWKISYGNEGFTRITVTVDPILCEWNMPEGRDFIQFMEHDWNMWHKTVVFADKSSKGNSFESKKGIDFPVGDMAKWYGRWISFYQNGKFVDCLFTQDLFGWGISDKKYIPYWPVLRSLDEITATTERAEWDFSYGSQGFSKFKIKVIK